MRRRRKHRPHTNHERWLVSYADFITLLFAFFVVLYASSQVDKKKVGKLALAIQVAFQEMGVFETSSAKVPVDMENPMPFDNVETVESLQRNATLAQVAAHPGAALGGGGGENGDLADLQHELENTLALEISRKEISMRREPDGLVISLREVGFFESGSGAMKQESQAAFDRIAELLLKRKCRLRIEGHTDNVPIHTPRFSSNWELSTARATEIIRLLIVRDGFDPRNLGAAGYGQYHPIASNNTKEGQSMNRRVDIVILGGTAPAAPAAFGPPRDPAAPNSVYGPVPRPSQ
jgi:chemotaxis protein MotB